MRVIWRTVLTYATAVVSHPACSRACVKLSSSLRDRSSDVVKYHWRNRRSLSYGSLPLSLD